MLDYMKSLAIVDNYRFHFHLLKIDIIVRDTNLDDAIQVKYI